MTAPVCLHPNCKMAVPPGRVCCARHFHQLNQGQKETLRFSLRQGGRELEEFKLQIVEYFESRLIGDLEISFCRDCHQDIVFLVTSKGFLIPVNVDDSVKAGDDQYKYGKHTRHKDTCPGRAA